MQLLGERGIGECRGEKKDWISPHSTWAKGFPTSPARELLALAFSAPVPASDAFSLGDTKRRETGGELTVGCGDFEFWFHRGSHLLGSYLLFRVFKLLFHSFCPDRRDSLEYAYLQLTWDWNKCLFLLLNGMGLTVGFQFFFVFVFLIYSFNRLVQKTWLLQLGRWEFGDRPEHSYWRIT